MNAGGLFPEIPLGTAQAKDVKLGHATFMPQMPEPYQPPDNLTSLILIICTCYMPIAYFAL